MKKIFALLILALLVSTGSAFAAAAEVADTDNPAVGGGVLYAVTPDDTAIGKMSKGVRIAGVTSLTNYALATAHLSGSKCYGSAADSTSIFNTECANGALADGTPAVVGVAAFGNLWTSL